MQSEVAGLEVLEMVMAVLEAIAAAVLVMAEELQDRLWGTGLESELVGAERVTESDDMLRDWRGSMANAVGEDEARRVRESVGKVVEALALAAGGEVDARSGLEEKESLRDAPRNVEVESVADEGDGGVELAPLQVHECMDVHSAVVGVGKGYDDREANRQGMIPITTSSHDCLNVLPKHNSFNNTNLEASLLEPRALGTCFKGPAQAQKTGAESYKSLPSGIDSVLNSNQNVKALPTPESKPTTATQTPKSWSGILYINLPNTALITPTLPPPSQLR